MSWENVIVSYGETATAQPAMRLNQFNFWKMIEILDNYS